MIRSLRRAWNWLTGRKPVHVEIQDLIHGLTPEDTPLMQIMRRQMLPKGHPDHLPTRPRGRPPIIYDCQERKEP